MSLKQWTKSAGPAKSKTLAKAASFASSVSQTSLPDANEEWAMMQAAERRERSARYATPVNKDGGLDMSVWLEWAEMEGDEDGSGDIAIQVGELDGEPTRLEPLGHFDPDHEGWTIVKCSKNPVFSAGYGQNVGPSENGHCVWNVRVLRRDGIMFIGVVIAQRLTGELDRRWDTPCWDRQCFFWATTAGTINSGNQIVKTLPTNKVPHYHFQGGDVVSLNLTVDKREVLARVLSVEQPSEFDLSLFEIQLRVHRDFGATTDMLEDLPALYYDSTVYEVIGFDVQKQIFSIHSRVEYIVGQVLQFRYTSDMHILLNGDWVARVKGVPHDVKPAVCLSSNGDMVRLEPGWSSKEQQSLDTIRESLSVHFKDRDLFFEFIEDREEGLTDWIILKAFRACEFDAAVAANDVSDYVVNNAGRIINRNKARLAARQKAMAFTSYAEDHSKSDRFQMKDYASEAKRWRPVSIDDALAWQEPHERRNNI